MTDELTRVIKYSDGHKCIPNGVGDYTFVCPTLGNSPGFIPFFRRTLLKGKCKCGKQVKCVED